MKWDTIVIGGGISGLTASIYAAMAGHSVMLLERGEKLGGRAASLTVKGSVLNAGPHALYRTGHAMASLRELGIPAAGGQLPQAGHLMRDGKLLPLPGGAGTLLRSPLLSWSGKIGIAKLLAGLQRIDPQAYRGVSWQDWLADRFPRDRGARQLMLALGRLWSYADCPERYDAGAMLEQAQVGMRGVYYLHNGWQSLVDALRKRAEAEGVKIATVKADAVTADNGNIRGVVTADGERHDASTVIAAVPPGEVLRLLQGAGERIAEPLKNRLGGLSASYASCLDIVMRQLPHPERNFALHLDRPLYYSNHSMAAALSREGHQVIHLLKYHAAPEAMDAVRDREELEGWMDALQPGWRKAAVTERYLPRMTTACAIPERGAGQRPDVGDTGVAGLYVSGDWVGRHGQLADAAVASAKQAAHCAIRRLRGQEGYDAIGAISHEPGSVRSL